MVEIGHGNEDETGDLRGDPDLDTGVNHEHQEEAKEEIERFRTPKVMSQ